MSIIVASHLDRRTKVVRQGFLWGHEGRSMNSFNKREHKSTLADAELIAVSEEVSSYFPRPVSDTLVTLMEVDPYTIYAYWNVEPSRMESMLDTLRDAEPEGSLTLRVHTLLSDAQNTCESFFDSEIQGMQSSIYINVTPLTSYVAEIGLLDSDDGFFVLAKSNKVITPPDYQAHRGSEHDDGQDAVLPQRRETRAPAKLISDKLLDASPSTPLSVFPPVREGGPDTVNTGAQPLGAFYTGGDTMLLHSLQ